MAYDGPNPYPIAAGGTGAITATQARINLGLQIGVNVQAFDATLQSISALGTVADRMIYTTGVDTWAETPITTFGRSLANSANAGAAQTTLGLVIGTNVQAFDATLQSISALGTAADRMIYTTGIDTWAEAAITSYGRSLVNSANAGAAQTTLGLVIGTNVQAQDATLQSISALGTTADRMIYTTGVDTWAESVLTAFARTLNAAVDQAAAQTVLGIAPGNGGCLVTTYTSGVNSFTKNANSKKIEIFLWGGGAGGGSGCANTSGGGGGGGSAGQFVYSQMLSAGLAGSTTVTVGAGGAGGTAVAAVNNGNPGVNGNPTSFGTLLIANGGLLGAGGTAGTNGAGGAGTTSLNQYIATISAGAAAGSGTSATPPSAAASNNVSLPTGGGAGGGWSGTTFNPGSAGGAQLTFATAATVVAGGTGGSGAGGGGGAGGPGNSPTATPYISGGTGGGGGGALTAVGGAGGSPGGGGGGGSAGTNAQPSGAGGAGGSGRAVIIEWF